MGRTLVSVALVSCIHCKKTKLKGNDLPATVSGRHWKTVKPGIFHNYTGTLDDAGLEILGGGLHSCQHLCWWHFGGYFTHNICAGGVLAVNLTHACEFAGGISALPIGELSLILWLVLMLPGSLYLSGPQFLVTSPHLSFTNSILLKVCSQMNDKKFNWERCSKGNYSVFQHLWGVKGYWILCQLGCADYFLRGILELSVWLHS